MKAAWPARSLAFVCVESPYGYVTAACSARGVVAVALPPEDPQRFVDGFGVTAAPPLPLPQARAALAGVELRKYFGGKLTAFSVPLDLQGTPFQLAVWQAVCVIPCGETRTYGALAAALGRPAAARAVGHANGANPAPIIVPCHRLVGSNGALTGYGGGIELKRALLAHEQLTTAR